MDKMVYAKKIFRILIVSFLMILILDRFILFRSNDQLKLCEINEAEFGFGRLQSPVIDLDNLTAHLPDSRPIDVQQSNRCFNIEDLISITQLPEILPWTKLEIKKNENSSFSNSIHLITQWYHEKYFRRRRELLAVLRMNLINNAVTSIHFIQYSTNCTIFDDIKLDPSFPVNLLKSKLVISYQTEINSTERLTISKALSYANRVINNGYAVVLNLDIFFDPSLELLRQMPLFHKSTIFYLSRYEVDSTISTSNAHCTDKGYMGSHDALIFQPPLSNIDVNQFPYELGTWHIEVKIIADLTIANYTVRNVCKTVRSWHLHSTQIRHRTMPSKKYIPDGLLYLYLRSPEPLYNASHFSFS